MLIAYNALGSTILKDILDGLQDCDPVGGYTLMAGRLIARLLSTLCLHCFGVWNL